MKKLLLGVLIGLVTTIPIVSLAGSSEMGKGEWSEWWNAGDSIKVKRIYDKENRLVCWMAISSWRTQGSISCQPSLELDHPSTRFPQESKVKE